MTEHEVRQLIHRERKPGMEFSKKLILGTLIFIGMAFIASIVSWHVVDDWPREIAEFFVWPFILGVVGYMCKSAYENKAKIERGYKNDN